MGRRNDERTNISLNEGPDENTTWDTSAIRTNSLTHFTRETVRDVWQLEYWVACAAEQTPWGTEACCTWSSSALVLSALAGIRWQRGGRHFLLPTLHSVAVLAFLAARLI